MMDLQRLNGYLHIIARAGRIASCDVWYAQVKERAIPNMVFTARVSFSCTEDCEHEVHTGIVTFLEDGTAKATYSIRCNGSESSSHIGAKWLRAESRADEKILWHPNGDLTWSGACNFLLLMVFASNEEAIPGIELDLEMELRHIRTIALR